MFLGGDHDPGAFAHGAIGGDLAQKAHGEPVEGERGSSGDLRVGDEHVGAEVAVFAAEGVKLHVRSSLTLEDVDIHDGDRAAQHGAYAANVRAGSGGSTASRPVPRRASRSRPALLAAASTAVSSAASAQQTTQTTETSQTTTSLTTVHSTTTTGEEHFKKIFKKFKYKLIIYRITTNTTI